MRKLGKKTKFRVTFLLLGLIISSVFFVSETFSYVSQIIKTRNEIESLKLAYENKLEEEEDLNKLYKKLEDPEYMARYTREKYLYSKKNEIIIKIED
ncbi:MAG: septum formation initiator family protein [Bacilli bacterium]|nr:septum formation initiator family protein [Bacilli bacterium]